MNRQRGRRYPELSVALVSFLSSNDTLANLHAIHMETVQVPEHYGAPANGISIAALRNLRDNADVLPQTARVVRNFLAIHAPDLLPMEALEPVRLNLGGFFGMPPDKLRLYGAAINGCFQTYAISTTIPSLVRRGKINFCYDSVRREIRVEEYQFRPQVGSNDEMNIKWDGFSIARGNKYFLILRTSTTLADLFTPLQSADLSSAVWASLIWRSKNEFDDGLAHGR